MGVFLRRVFCLGVVWVFPGWFILASLFFFCFTMSPSVPVDELLSKSFKTCNTRRRRIGIQSKMSPPRGNSARLKYSFVTSEERKKPVESKLGPMLDAASNMHQNWTRLQK